MFAVFNRPVVAGWVVFFFFFSLSLSGLTLPLKNKHKIVSVRHVSSAVWLKKEEGGEACGCLGHACAYPPTCIRPLPQGNVCQEIELFSLFYYFSRLSRFLGAMYAHVGIGKCQRETEPLVFLSHKAIFSPPSRFFAIGHPASLIVPNFSVQCAEVKTRRSRPSPPAAALATPPKAAPPSPQPPPPWIPLCPLTRSLTSFASTAVAPEENGFIMPCFWLISQKMSAILFRSFFLLLALLFVQKKNVSLSWWMYCAVTTYLPALVWICCFYVFWGEKGTEGQRNPGLKRKKKMTIRSILYTM